MSWWEALLLGIVQGLTEFLPISSSGHLVLTNYLLGVVNESLVFEVSVHLGTLVAVIVYFRRDLLQVIRDFFAGGEMRRVGWLLILATVPTAIIGLAFKDTFEAAFASPRWASGGLLVTSLILFLAERVRREGRPMAKTRWGTALLVGFFQGLAIMPGVSRSGSTIGAGLFGGMERDAAARFSFLLAIPAILGAAVLNAKDFASLPHEVVMPSLVGVVASALSGYAAIGVLMAVLRRGRLYGFAVYTLIVGVAGLILLP